MRADATVRRTGFEGNPLRNGCRIMAVWDDVKRPDRHDGSSAQVAPAPGERYSAAMLSLPVIGLSAEHRSRNSRGAAASGYD